MTWFVHYWNEIDNRNVRTSEISTERRTTRPRGFAPWNPQTTDQALFAQVQDVLTEYPNTCRSPVTRFSIGSSARMALKKTNKPMRGFVRPYAGHGAPD
jgi:hypothetical protein